MLKWADKTELTDADVKASADGTIKWDLKEAKYMLKLSSKAWLTGLEDSNKNVGI